VGSFRFPRTGAHYGQIFPTSGKVGYLVCRIQDMEFVELLFHEVG
jgi:hypothetical protein